FRMKHSGKCASGRGYSTTAAGSRIPDPGSRIPDPGTVLPLQRDSVSATVQIVHRLHREHDCEVELRLGFRAFQPEVHLVSTLDHVLEYLVDRVLVLAGAGRNHSSHFLSHARD